MAYELLSEGRKHNKQGGPNKSRRTGNFFEKKKARRRLLRTREYDATL